MMHLCVLTLAAVLALTVKHVVHQFFASAGFVKRACLDGSFIQAHVRMREIDSGLVVQVYNLRSLGGGGRRIRDSMQACAAEEVQSQPEQLGQTLFQTKN